MYCWCGDGDAMAMSCGCAGGVSSILTAKIAPSLPGRFVNEFTDASLAITFLTIDIGEEQLVTAKIDNSAINFPRDFLVNIKEFHPQRNNALEAAHVQQVGKGERVF